MKRGASQRVAQTRAHGHAAYRSGWLRRAPMAKTRSNCKGGIQGMVRRRRRGSAPSGATGQWRADAAQRPRAERARLHELRPKRRVVALSPSVGRREEGGARRQCASCERLVQRPPRRTLRQDLVAAYLAVTTAIITVITTAAAAAVATVVATVVTTAVATAVTTVVTAITPESPLTRRACNRCNRCNSGEPSDTSRL